MITLDIPATGTKKYFPTDLSECDARQYGQMAHLIYQLQSQEINYTAFRVRAVYALLNMEPVHSPDLGIQEEKMANIYRLSELLDGFFEESEGSPKVLKQYYVHNPVPRVRPYFRAYHGPRDEFSNICFGEYVDALHYFSEYHETGDQHFLYMLMAVMYRPKKRLNFKGSPSYSRDIRRKYNEYQVEARASIFKALYFGDVYGFFLLFASFQKYLCSAKIYWQGRELDLSILFSDKDHDGFVSDIPGIGMKSTLYTLAESGVFGTMKELRYENLWEILMRMYDLTKRDLDYKARTKSTKN